MIRIDKKNKWAVNIGLHIPIPSISIELISDREEELKVREPLSHNREKEEAYNAASQKNDSCAAFMQKEKKAKNPDSSSESDTAPASGNTGASDEKKAAKGKGSHG